MIRFLALPILGLLACAEASADCIPIDHAPYVITDPGSYCLPTSYTVNIATGSAIEVLSDDVSIDFAGNTLRNVNGTGTRALGVSARDKWNIQVSGGTVAGFQHGVHIDTANGSCSSAGGSGYRVESMRIENSMRSGISLTGCRLVARNNWVSKTGINSFIPATGISLRGTLISAVDNDVQGIVGEPRASSGINISIGTGIVEGNRIQASPNGIAMPVGGLVPYRDNTTVEIHHYPYSGGQDAGGNF